MLSIPLINDIFEKQHIIIIFYITSIIFFNPYKITRTIYKLKVYTLTLYHGKNK